MNKLYLAITVDTEGHKGENPIENLVYGKIGHEYYGIDLIMDICEKYGVRAIFFVDIAAAWDFGDEEIKGVIKRIIDRGHDAQIHIHPDHMADDKRMFLWEYSREEQKEIIGKCIDKYRELSGKRAAAFRAGKYAANYDTLDILSTEGIRLDFSQFYSQKWCGLNKPPLTVNRVKKYKNLFEIPVTVYKSFDICKVRRYDKIDINTITVGEFRKVLNNIKQNKETGIITLFVHSFSFLKRYNNDNKIKVNRRVINRFDRILQTVSDDSEIEVVTTEEINSLIGEKELVNRGDFIPAINNYFLMIYYNTFRSLRIVRTNRKARVFLVMVFLLLLMVFSAIGFSALALLRFYMES